jgi:hypothetical protein
MKKSFFNLILQAFLLLTAMLVTAFGARADEIGDNSIYLGKASTKNLKLKSAITFSETLTEDSPFQVGGLIVITDKHTHLETDCLVTGVYLPQIHGFSGFCSYFDHVGRKHKYKVGGLYNPHIGLLIIAVKIGNTLVHSNCLQYSSPDISGTWGFVNDPSAPMHIAVSKKIPQFIGTYHGTGFHSNLKGTLIGTVTTDSSTGATAWSGTFSVIELDNHVAGTFTCDYSYRTPPIMDCTYSTGAAFELLAR